MEVHMDMTVLARNWGAIAIRGVAAILFGVLTFVVPGLTLAALVLLFGAYAIIDGIFAIVAAVRRTATGTGTRTWWVLSLEGIVGVAAGVVTFVWPGLTALTLVYVIAAWAIVTGVLEIVEAVRLRQQITGEWWLVLGGAVSIILGGFLIAAPGAGALALVLWIGAYAIVFGVLLLALAFRLRRVHAEHRDVPYARAA
jgi:uncharacterized membrane protein HdeD (DUF308 family)